MWGNDASSEQASWQDYIHEFEVQLVRVACGKPPTSIFPAGCKTGKLTTEKANQVKDAWVRHIESKFAGKSISALVGYTFLPTGSTDVDAGEDEAVHSLHTARVIRCPGCVLSHIRKPSLDTLCNVSVTHNIGRVGVQNMFFQSCPHDTSRVSHTSMVPRPS
jgi:hypothetical protein